MNQRRSSKEVSGEDSRWRTGSNDKQGSMETDGEGKSKVKNVYTKDSGQTWTEREMAPDYGEEVPFRNKANIPLPLVACF